MSASQDWIDEGVWRLRLGAFDRKAVARFMNDAFNRRTIDPTDANHAAVLLIALMKGVHEGEDIGVAFRRLLKVRKLRSKKFDARNAPMDTLAFVIVEQYVRGEISHTKAVKRFMDEVCDAEKRTVEGWIAAMKPRVQKHVATINALIALSEDPAEGINAVLPASKGTAKK